MNISLSQKKPEEEGMGRDRVIPHSIQKEKNPQDSDVTPSPSIANKFPSEKSNSTASLKVMKKKCHEITKLQKLIQVEDDKIAHLENELVLAQQKEDDIMKRIHELEKQSRMMEQQELSDDEASHASRRACDSSIDCEQLFLQLASRDRAIKAMEDALAENLKKMQEIEITK